MEEAVEKTTLENGIRILTKQMPFVRSASVGIWANVGSRDEQAAANGACHFIEHMIFKGTRRRSAYDIALEMDAIGGHSNAFTTMEHTCFHGKVLSKHLPRLVDILTDIFLASVFDPEEVRRERDVIYEEIRMLEDTPDEYLHLLCGAAVFGEHPLGRSILGTRETLSRMDADSLRQCFHDWYRPESIIITAGGDVDHQQFVDLISPTFAAMPSGNELPAREAPVPKAGVFVSERQLEQVHLCLATRGLAASDPRRYSYSLLNILLGGNMSSRLFQQIRENRGLAYNVYSFAPAFMDCGMLGVYAAVHQDNVRETIEVILEQMARFRDEKLTPRDLEGAKDYIKGSIFMSAESTDSQMLRLAQNEVQFGRYIPLAEVAANIDEVTADHVVDIASHIFRQDHLALTMLGPVSSGTDYQAILGL
ncbi:MAG: M16 family metallopeptidase [Desulfatibacillaceae bacterium]